MESIVKVFQVLSLEQWLIVILVACAAVQALFKTLGWSKGLAFIEEFRIGLACAKKYLDRAETAGGIMSRFENIEKAANQIAMKVPGVTGQEMLSVATKLLKDKEVDYGGLKLSIDKTGVSVDPSGLAANKARKVSKWFKKIF